MAISLTRVKEYSCACRCTDRVILNEISRKIFSFQNEYLTLSTSQNLISKIAWWRARPKSNKCIIVVKILTCKGSNKRDGQYSEVTVDNSSTTITYWFETPFVSSINQAYISNVQSDPVMPILLSLLTPYSTTLSNQIRQCTTVVSTYMNLLESRVLSLPITDVKP